MKMIELGTFVHTLLVCFRARYVHSFVIRDLSLGLGVVRILCARLYACIGALHLHLLVNILRYHILVPGNYVLYILPNPKL
jgi:hypothetical protein